MRKFLLASAALLGATSAAQAQVTINTAPNPNTPTRSSKTSTTGSIVCAFTFNGARRNISSWISPKRFKSESTRFDRLHSVRCCDLDHRSGSAVEFVQTESRSP